MPRNESPANTVMKDVAPGDETGVYYLLISSLPFGTKWQLFKDWVREADCDVDHIELFQKSTNGWIRLLGRDNFDRALRHLRTNPFAGREIIVDERNRTEPIKILELIDDPPPKPKFGWRFQRSRRKGDIVVDDAASVSSRNEMRQLPRLTESMVASIEDEAPQQGRERASIRASPVPSYPASTIIQHVPLGSSIAPMGYISRQPFKSSAELQGAAFLTAGEMPFAINGWNLHYGPAYAQSYRAYEAPLQVNAGLQVGLQPSTPNNLAYSHRLATSSLKSPPGWDGSSAVPLATPTPSAPAAPPNSSLSPLQRQPESFHKVQVLSLKHAASAQDVEQWVRRCMGEWASGIVRVDVPIDHQKGRIRGSAYITLSSAAAAGKAVEALQQKMFMGRLVYARRASNMDVSNKEKKEGEKAEAQSHTAHSNRRNAEATIDDKSIPAPQTRAKDKPENAQYTPPVIAHGTNYKPPR